jgi:hypothetical protein
MKIAVCLYGEPRTALYCAPWIKECFNFDSGRATLIWNPIDHWHTNHVASPEFQVDYFCDIKQTSWAKNDRGAKEQTVPHSTRKKIIETFAPKKYSHTPKALDIRLCKNKPFHTSMFSSICRSVLLKQQAELEMGESYDGVFVSRYDVLLGPKIDTVKSIIHTHGIQPLVIYGNYVVNHRFPIEAFRGGFADMFFWGDSFSIDALSARLYSLWASNNQDDLVEPFASGPNTYLSMAVSDAGLVYQPTQTEVAIVRDTADLTKPVLESWDYHAAFWSRNAVWYPKDNDEDKLHSV